MTSLEDPLILESGEAQNGRHCGRFKETIRKHPCKVTKKACCNCLVLTSLSANIALGLAILILLSSSSAYEPVFPNKPGNDTKSSCPFSSLDGDSYKNNIAATEISADFITLCWRDQDADVRGTVQAPYVLKVDDFWSSVDINEANAVYMGRSLHFNATDLLPGLNYEFSLHTLESKKDSRLTVRTFERGLCGNRKDIEAQKRNQATMKKDIQQCMINHVFSDEDALSCIEKNVELSRPCASCWIQEGHCTLKKCASKCFIPSSQQCKDCSQQYCFDECVKCTGLPSK